MDTQTQTPSLTYYQKNKSHYQKGGKYYKYKAVEVRQTKIPIVIKHGRFIISFD